MPIIFKLLPSPWFHLHAFILERKPGLQALCFGKYLSLILNSHWTHLVFPLKVKN